MAKTTAGNLPTDIKKRVTTYMLTSKIKAIKYIAFTDSISQSDIIDQSLDQYIKQWEQKNGAIPKK